MHRYEHFDSIYGVDIVTNIYGKPVNYSMKNINALENFSIEEEKLFREIFRHEVFSDVNRFLSPHPGVGTLADISVSVPIKRISNRLYRGFKGDIVELEKGDAYVVSAADCLVGSLIFPDKKVFAFHAGYRELLGFKNIFEPLIPIFSSLSKNDEVYGEFGFATEQKYLSLRVQENDMKEEMTHIIKQGRELEAVLERKDHIELSLDVAFLNLVGSYFKGRFEYVNLPSNTWDNKRFWSHRLDEKRGSNLVIINRAH